MPLQSTPEGVPCWFDLMTPNLEAASAFYGAVFGWTFKPAPDSPDYILCYLGDRIAAGIGQRPTLAPFPTAWTVYLCTANADRTALRMREKGGEVVLGPVDVQNLGRLTFCRDPLGTVFGTWEGRALLGAEVRDEPGSMTWAEVGTSDIGITRDFYASVFSMDPVPLPKREYWVLHKGPGPAFGIFAMGDALPREIVPQFGVHFRVPNCAATVDTVREKGGSLKMPAFETAQGRTAVVRDPWGAVFSVVQKNS